MLRNIRWQRCLIALLGSGILAFGLYHVHALADVTEGGVLGLTLLLEYWPGISPAVSGLVLNGLCFLLGYRVLGREFAIYTAVSAGGFSLFYAVCEQFPPLWPGLYAYPLAAALLGAVFVGVGVGLCVAIGGAPSGDDALAMALSRMTRLPIQWVYLLTDLTVLGLSAVYLPWNRLGWSLLTVVLSGQIIGFLQRILPCKNTEKP